MLRPIQVFLVTTLIVQGLLTSTALAASLSEGQGFFNKGLVQQAIGSFQQLVTENPNHAEAYLWLARSYKKQGDKVSFALAKDAYENVLRLNPNHIESLENLGEILSWDPAQRNRAIELLNRAHVLSPKNLKSTKLLMDVLTWQGRLNEAGPLAKSIYPAYQNDRKFLETYALIQTWNGNPTEAINLYERRLNVANSKDLNLTMAYMQALVKANRTDEASRQYQTLKQQVLASSPEKRTENLGQLASLAYILGYFEEALAIDLAQPEAWRQNTSVQLRMARTYGRLNRASDAIAVFDSLYTQGRLLPKQKVEYADYLSSLTGTQPTLVNAARMMALYQEAQRSGAITDAGELYLRLARASSLDEAQFDQTVDYYQQAIAGGSKAARQELVDKVMASKGHLPQAEAVLKNLMAQYPNDTELKGQYAEFLSWQESRRVEAIRLYFDLCQNDPMFESRWREGLDQVLGWHKPSMKNIDLYEQIAKAYPDLKGPQLSMARAYKTLPDYYTQANRIYRSLREQYPNDPSLTTEWVGLMTEDPKRRSEAMAVLKEVIAQHPNDLKAKVAYGSVLSYQRQYTQSIALFDEILAGDATNRDALLGKGYALLWSGDKMKAKAVLQRAYQAYPGDEDVAMALAEAEKRLGRYDRALEIYNTIKKQQQTDRSSSSSSSSLLPRGIQVASGDTTGFDMPMFDSKFDFGDSSTPGTPSHETPPLVLKTPEHQKIKQELNALDASLKALDEAQQQSAQALQSMQGRVSLQNQQSAAVLPTLLNTSTMAGSSDETETPTLAQYATMHYDVNPLLSGMGRFRNNPLDSVADSVERDLRPMFITGFQYTMQDGNPNANRLRTKSFINQLSLSLTPQLRIRGGVTPTKYFMKNAGVSPNNTWGLEYMWGGTYKLNDHLTFDGEMSINQYTQSSTNTIHYDAKAIIDFSDRYHLTLGSRRIPNQTSLLSWTGMRPNLGPEAGRLIGQVRETSIYTDLSMTPFHRNWDINGGWEFAWVDANQAPSNTRNQFYASTGYTQYYGETHRARLTYEFLYFGYDKNATLGYYDLTSAAGTGVTSPLVTPLPQLVSSDGYVRGGYYSPDRFFLNAGRLDLYGSFKNKLIEYKLGGSLGVQASNMGHGLGRGATLLASSWDANVIFNWTDWLATYGHIDYMDVGTFNRWRFGGGFILRPGIAALSPVIGGRSR